MKTKSPLTLLCLVVFFDLAGFSMFFPLQEFLLHHFETNVSVITTLIGLYSVLQFFFAPLWGRISDRVGRRPVLILSEAAAVLSYLIMAASNSLALFFVARALTGVASGNLSAAMAYAADVSEEKDRARSMGMLGASIGLGFVIGPVIGGLGAWLGRAIGGENSRWIFAIPGLIAAGLSFSAMLGVMLALPESRHAKGAERRPGRAWSRLLEYARTPQIGLTLAIMLIFSTAFSWMELTFAFLAADRFSLHAQGIGLSMGLLGLASAFSQGGLVRRLVPRFGEPRVIVAGAAIVAITLCVLSHAPSLGWFLLVCVVLAIGAGLMRPSLASHLSKVCNPEEYGRALGLGQGLSSLGRALPVWACGYFYENFGMHVPFWFAGGLVAVCAILGAGLRRKPSS